MFLFVKVNATSNYDEIKIICRPTLRSMLMQSITDEKSRPNTPGVEPRISFRMESEKAAGIIN